MGNMEINIELNSNDLKALDNRVTVEKIDEATKTTIKLNNVWYKNKASEEDIALVVYWIKDWDRRWIELIKKLIDWTFNVNDYLRG